MQIKKEFLVSAGRGTVLRGNDRRLYGFNVRFADPRRRRATVSSSLLSEVLTCTRDGKALFVEQALDFKDRFDVLAAIQAVSARAFHWLKGREFGFPIAQDEGFCGR